MIICIICSQRSCWLDGGWWRIGMWTVRVLWAIISFIMLNKLAVSTVSTGLIVDFLWLSSLSSSYWSGHVIDLKIKKISVFFFSFLALNRLVFFEMFISISKLIIIQLFDTTKLLDVNIKYSNHFNKLVTYVSEKSKTKIKWSVLWCLDNIS